MALYNYEDYFEVRKEVIKKRILEKTSSMSEEERLEFLEDVFVEFEDALSSSIGILYDSVGISVNPYEYHSSLGKISEPNIRRQISDMYLTFDIITEAINELTDAYDDNRNYTSIEELLSNADENNQEYIMDTIRHYELTYLEKVKYLGSGQSSTVFCVGDKVFKFGEIRRYGYVPFCLPYHDLHRLDDKTYMYVTDKVDTSSMSISDSRKVYIELRDKGFVWLDPKPENIGTRNGEYVIIDDIDILTERHILKDGNESVLKFVSNNSLVTELELDYLSSKDPNFDINEIDKYFNNQSPATKELIQSIKTEYEKRKRSYEFDSQIEEQDLFNSILNEKLSEMNKSI